MNDSHRLETIATHNARSLKTLARAISMGKGKFSLIVVRCNYEILQEDILQLLRQQCPQSIADFWVPRSAISLYTTIQENFGDKSTDALVLFGLESVNKLDLILESANRLRDEFRNLSFPLVLWLTDVGLKKLMQQAPDFNSFGSVPIYFTLPDEELKALICQRVDAAVNDAANFYIQSAEIEALRQDMADRKSVLNSEIQTGFTFLLGWDLARNGRIDEAIAKYQECLQFWQQNHNLEPALEKQGLVLLNLGWASCQKKAENASVEARDYLQQSLAIFEKANRKDLVSKYIGFLGKILRNIKAWPELKQLAENALKLHEVRGENEQVARDYGWLAEVALQELRYQQAEHFARKAWEIADAKITVKERALYGFILGQSLAELGSLEQAIAILAESSNQLETARKEKISKYDAKLHVEILKKLRNWQSQQKQYREAFQNKLLQRQIESQYGWRAFVGAGRLQPPAKHLEETTTEEKTEEKTEVVREIAAALGREADINRLIERIKNPQHKLTVIYGQSGVGKSSILQAGLIPALQLAYFEGRDYLPILVLVYKDWTHSLGHEVRSKRFSVSSHTPSSPMAASSPDWILSQLRENEYRGRLTILIFDQFEEFFFDNPDPKSREKFYRFLQECLTIPYLKAILSLREDYIYYLLEFSRNYPLKNIQQPYEEMLYYLGNFEPEDAKGSISSLTARSQFSLESDLVEELVADLARQFDGVRPIELQVVGAQLETEKITTLGQYRQLGENPKEVLVEKFLAEAVKDCGEENQRVAELVLYLLTNAQNTRPLKTNRELTEDLEIEQKQLDLVLEVLVGSGLVLLLPETPEKFYQLVHDYLVPFVRQKYEPQLLELEREREERRRLERENEALEAKSRIKKIFLRVSIAASVALACLAGTAAIFGVARDWENIISLANESRALMLSDRPLDAKLKAIKAGRKFLKYQSFLSPTDRFIVVTDSLQQAVYQQKGELFRESNRLVGHDDWVYGVSFSPDGKLIASTSWDYTVKIWHRDGELLQTLDDHQGLVRDVSFSPDGKLIATASWDKTVKLWDIQGKELQTLDGHQEPVIAVSFSLDGKLIATASQDNTVKLWNLDGKLLKTLNGHSDSVYGVSFSPDGKLIATASWDKTVKLWNSDGKLLKTLAGQDGHQDKVYDVSFSPDGKLIATASADNTVKLWNIDGKWLQTLTGHTGPVISVSFSPDEDLIASASGDNTVKLWQTDGEKWHSVQTLTGHQDWVNAVNFSRDSKLIATASDDRTVKLWRRVDRKQTLAGHGDWVNSVSFSPDGELIATASDDNTVKLWGHNGKEWQTLQTLKSDGNFINALSVNFSPDGQLIAAASYGNNVKLWSRDDRLWPTLALPTLAWKEGHKELVRDVSFSPDGELIATASWDKTVKLWNHDGQLKKIFNDENNECTGDEGDEGDEKCQTHNEPVIAVSFSPDGKLIATASRDNTVKLWNHDGKLLPSLIEHQGAVYGVSFSPDGKLIATASWDKTVKLWNTDGKLLKTLAGQEGHKDKVYDVSFSPDGKLIASASWDKTVKLWSRDGKLLQTFTGHKGPVISVSFSPDGQTIASASGDKTVIIWDVWDFEELMKINCQWVGGYLRNSQEVKESDKKLCDGFEE